MKKFIALAVVLVFLIFTCSISVFADGEYFGNDDTPMTTVEYYEQIDSLVAEYASGNIDYDTFHISEQAVTEQFYNENLGVDGSPGENFISSVNTVSAVANKVKAIVDTYGPAAQDVISSLLSGLLDPYKTTSDAPTTDLGGAVCQLKTVNSSTGEYYIYYGCEPGELFYNDNEIWLYIKYDRRELYKKSGALVSTKENISSTSMEYKKLKDGVYVLSGQIYLYGSWVWRDDGNEAPTDDTYETSEGYDFSQATDDELVDLLNEILAALENANPDLSSIEGILTAIYYRLGTLDSDNDAAALSQIAAAISAIDNDNSDVVKTLEDIKTAISSGSGSDDLEEYREKILAYLYPGEEELTEAQKFATDVKGLFFTKFAFIDEFKDFFSNLQWGSDDSFSLDLTFNGKSYPMEPSGLGELAEIVRYMLAFFIYGSFAIRAYKRMPEIISTGGGDE